MVCSDKSCLYLNVILCIGHVHSYQRLVGPCHMIKIRRSSLHSTAAKRFWRVANVACRQIGSVLDWRSGSIPDLAWLELASGVFTSFTSCCLQSWIQICGRCCYGLLCLLRLFSTLILSPDCCFPLHEEQPQDCFEGWPATFQARCLGAIRQTGIMAR